MKDYSHLYVDTNILRERYACEMQIDRFEKEFGTGRVHFTKKNWARARRAGMQTGWLAHMVMRRLRVEGKVTYRQFYRFVGGGAHGSYAGMLRMLRRYDP